MEDVRFETSELQASFMMSTPLWSDSWTLCNAANFAGSVQIKHIAGIMYVALPVVETSQLGDLVGLEVAGGELFSALSASLASHEPPPMVDAAMLNLFVDLLPHIQSQINQGLELEGRKQLVVTGHSTGGALATLTALWLLSQPSPLSIRLLCITFGSPLLGNQSLSSAISLSRLAHNFCHVVSIHDIVPRRNDERLYPFGTFLFCSENGGICLDHAASVLGMFKILNSTGTPNFEEHLRYEHYVSTLSYQFLKSRSLLGGDIPENTYQTGLALAVGSLGLSNDDNLSAKECIENATRIGRARSTKLAIQILRSTELAIELSNVLSSRNEIHLYKERCHASPRQLGYYDMFKQISNPREIRVNMSRAVLANFWDGVIKMVEKNELPFDFHLAKKWVYASQFYQLLAEPLDIAKFYKYDFTRTSGHYLENGNRPKRYVVIDKWWKQSGEPERENCVRTQYASTTQDTCFWAKVEEVKDCLDEMIRHSGDAHRQSLLWEKIVGFESYADIIVRKKEVSADVLAKNSSYSVWVKNLNEFKLKMGSGIEMVGNVMQWRHTMSE